MQFNSTDDIVVLPKVKLNSKAAIASMKTDAARATYVTAGTLKGWTDMAFIAKANAATYTVAAAES